MRDLPSGTVTFLFTDVEGSTKLLHELGAEAYADALAEHRRVLREAFGAQGGVEVDTQGDAFFVAFSTAPGALQAAAEALEALERGPIRVRMGIHTGTPHQAEEGYVGHDVHRAARIAACGHGGQVLVSTTTASLLQTDRLHDLGEHRLKDLSAPERIYQPVDPTMSVNISVVRMLVRRALRISGSLPPEPRSGKRIRDAAPAITRGSSSAPGMNRTCARGVGTSVPKRHLQAKALLRTLCAPENAPADSACKRA